MLKCINKNCVNKITNYPNYLNCLLPRYHCDYSHSRSRSTLVLVACSKTYHSDSCPQAFTLQKRRLKYDSRSRSRHCSCNYSRMSSSNFQFYSSMTTFNDLDTGTRGMSKFLVVGLGNNTHPDTRHSVGMMTVDNLIRRLDSQWEKSRVCGGFLGKSVIAGEDEMKTAELYAFKPQILMNLNGKSVLKAAKHLDITADRIYLIHDELDKAVGKSVIKYGGSARGHKGVLSCYDCLRPSPLWPKNSNGDFKGMTRLQIGIGRPSSQSQVVSYVLSRIPDEELQKINMAIDNGLDLLLKNIMSRMLT